jgi:triacylglycerol lipase
MHVIKRILLTISFVITIMPFMCYASNQDPIILVHGFTGWGRNDLKGFLYWGGFNDIQEDLKSEGHFVDTASVGALSSNYDRAIELYAQIKGSCADYGLAHSQKYGHARFGRCYPTPLYPQWDEYHKVHFVGHSQGGQTIRVLLQLLKDGSPDELELNYDDMNDLFSGNKNWVTSITTISTPNNGTTLTEIADVFLPTAQKLLTYFSAIIGIQKNPIIDLKMEQWGIGRKKNESISDYFYNVFHSNIWSTKDISKWDLSPEGAKQFNDQAKNYNDVYYFSISTKSTAFTNPFNNCKLSLFGILDFPSNAIGCYTKDHLGKVQIDSKWLENDGIVNTYSMQAPFNMKKINFNGTAQIGIWNDLGIKHGWNHIDIIGALPNLLKPYWSVKQIYSDHINLLHSL